MDSLRILALLSVLTVPGQAVADYNFEVVWEYPHLSEVEGDSREVHQITHRRPRKYAYDFDAEVRVLKKKHLIDGDFVVTLRRDEKILLRHVFHIRGCDVPA